MDLDAKKFKSLGNLMSRVVRGVKPGTFNTRSACKVFVTTSDSSDSAPVKEYLLEADVEKNTVVGEATFTNGSTKVTSKKAGTFGKINGGDTIRRSAELVYYAVSSVSKDGRSLVLRTPYTGGHAGSVLTGGFVARRTSVGSAEVSIIENTDLSPDSFVYNHTRGAWEPSSVAAPVASRPVNGALIDGITLNCVGRDDSPLPDVACTGVVTAFKTTSPAGHDSASLPLPAVPYPADESGVKVLESPAGSTSYRALGRDEYLIDYTGSPVPTLDQPLFRKRRDARLLRTKREMAYTDITNSYGGQWAVQDSKVRHTSILFGSEEVSLGDASNPAYVSEEMTLTLDDVKEGRRNLLRTPIGKVVLNVAEGSAQSDGLDFVVVDGTLVWKGYGLESEVYEGLVLRLYYQSSEIPLDLYPYMDYLLEPQSGTITTVNQQAGAIFSVQYIVLTSRDIDNRYVQLASSPVGAVALNVIGGSSSRPGRDFTVKGNILHWGGMGLDTDALRPGTTLRASYQSGSGEYPVEYLFQKVEAFWAGATAYRSKKDLKKINMESREEWGDKLSLGEDWNFNTTNGSFALLGAVADDDTTLFEYLGNGFDVVTEVLDPSLSPAGTVSDKLRLRYSPVVPGTLTVYSVGAGPRELLTDGVHYHMAVGTGSLTVLKATMKGARWHVSYLPAIAYYYAIKGKPAPGSEVKMRAILEPARVSSGTSIVVANKMAATLSASSIVVRKTSGEVIPLSGVRFDASSSRLTFAECKALSAGQVVTLDYDFSTRALPFMPSAQLPCHITKGANLIYIDGSRVGGLTAAGRLIGLASGGQTSYELFSIKNVINPDGANVCIQLGGRVSETMQSPSVLVSNKEVSFTPADGMVVEPYSADQYHILVNGRQDDTILPGMVMRVHRVDDNTEELYRVLSCSYDAETLISSVSLLPPTRTAGIIDNQNTTISFSSSPVYMEGDTSIVTMYPLLPGGFPLWKIEYVEDNGGYATLQVNKASAVLKEYLPEGTVEHGVAIDGTLTVDELAQALTSCGGGKKFSLKWLYPKGSGVLQSSLVRTGCEQALPYEVLSMPQLRRKAKGEESFRPLRYGHAAGDGEYRALGRNIILDRPLAIGDQYTVAYVGVDNLAAYRGRSLQVTSRRVVPIPESTKYAVTYEYLREDQFYIQSMTEADFLDRVAAPAVESTEEAREGQSPFGCLSLSPAPENDPSLGGLQDTMFLLRDELLKYRTYKKILDFYNRRYLQFAEEYAATTGVRPCRSITSEDQRDPEYTLRGSRELDHYATFGQATFFPDGYEDPTPLPDGRFMGKYPSFGSANFFNFKGSSGALEGVMLARGGGFLSRGVAVGDSIKTERSPQYLTVAQVVSEEEIRFTSKIPWKGDSGYKLREGSFKQKVRPVFSWMGTPSYKDVPRSGTGYWIKSPKSLPTVSQDGSPFASAYTSVAEPFPLSPDPSCSNVLCLETSEDGGRTWSLFEIDLSFLEPPYTADRVAHAIYSGASGAPASSPEEEEVIQGLESVLEVSTYQGAVSSGVAVERTLSDTWPLSLPDKEGSNGIGTMVSFRARSTTTWFRFIEPTSAEDGETVHSGASTLGLPVGRIFKGVTDYWSASLSLSRELVVREKELASYNRMLQAFDMTDRGEHQVYVEPSKLLLSAVSTENAASIESLDRACKAAALISAEDEGTDPMVVSAGEAAAAKTVYEQQLKFCLDTEYEDNAMQAVLSEPRQATMYLASLERASVDEQTANDSAAQSFIANGKPSVELPAPDGGSVLTNSKDGLYIFGVYTKVTNEEGGLSYLQDIEPPEDLKVIHLRPVTDVHSSSVSVSANQVLVSYKLTDISEEKSFSVALHSCPTLDDLVTALNKEVSGVLKATLNRGEISIEDFALLGGSPSSKVLPMPSQAAPAYLYTHGRPYIRGSAHVSMKAAVRVTLGDSSSRLTASPDGISVTIGDGRLFIVPVLPDDTFSLFATRATEALQGHASVELTGDIEGGAACIGFVSSPSLSGEALLYPSVKGSLEYGLASDRRLLDRIKVVSERVTAIKSYLDWYPTRKNQIAASVGASGEALTTKQHEWLCLLADKEIGPCTRIPQLKKRILSSRLYKGYMARLGSTTSV